MLRNETSLALDPGIHTSGFLILVPQHVTGTHELLVLLNGVFLYSTLQYEDVDSTHIRILFDSSVGDTLTLGLLSGYSQGAEASLVAPTSLHYAKDYTGEIVLGLSTTTDSRVTHLQVFRNREGTLTQAGQVASGTTSFTISDAKIGDEYFVRPYHSPGKILGPASALVRVLPVVGQAPRF